MENSSKWALVLGGSSGLGLATARKLAAQNFNILVIHRDRKSDMESIQKDFDGIRTAGVDLHGFNKDAISEAVRNELIQEFRTLLENQKISVVIHSIAKGNVKAMHQPEGDELAGQDFQITINAMAVSLYDWIKALLNAELLAGDTRVISYTSEGNVKAWPSYAAVSAAKVTLEAITRSIALEFAPLGIKANCIQAGVTDTKSLQYIPNSEQLKRAALRRNPNNRLTTPEDVANVAYLLTTEEAKWITGSIIKADGGESLQ